MASSISRTPFARTRSKGGMTVSTVSEALSGAPSGNGNTGGGGSSVAFGRYSVMSDVVTPGFKEKSARGDVVFSPMSKVERACSSSGSGFVIRQIQPALWANARYTGSGDWLAYMLANGAKTGITVRLVPNSEFNCVLTPFQYGDALSRAIAVASTKAQNIPSDASLLVAMAEWRKTLELLPGILNGWRSLFARVNAREAAFSRRRTADRRTDAARNLRDLQDELLNTWLAMRFGARPLVSDTLGIVKALNRARNPAEAVRTTSRGFARAELFSQENGSVRYGVTNLSVSAQHSSVSTVRAVSLWEAKIGVMDDLGVSLAQVPVAAVDLTRFSFLLNWVINLNDFVGALGSLFQPGWSSKGGAYVVETTSSSLYQAGTAASTQPTVYSLEQAVSGHVLVSQREKHRVVGLPSPSLVLRPNPLEWTKDFRLLDAVALLRGQTRGRGVSILAQISKTPGIF